MRERSEGAGRPKSTTIGRWREMLLFVGVSIIGIYALGNGTAGLMESGGGIDLLWLAVSGAALMILFWQMGRVHDTWPRRRNSRNR